MEPAPPALLVSRNAAGTTTPWRATLTEYDPAVVLAASAGAAATPEALVFTVITVGEPVAPNVAPVPTARIVNVTETLAAGLPFAFVTATCNGPANVVPTVALCPEPWRARPLKELTTTLMPLVVAVLKEGLVTSSV